jgi:aminopeptidase N
VRRDRLELDVTGGRTEISALIGVPAADVLLLNDEDLTYAKLRLDERSMSTVVSHISGFDSSLSRALCWAAAWDMVRDAEMTARDYVALVCAGLPSETDINLVTATLRQVQLAVGQYADARLDRDRVADDRRHRPGRVRGGRAGQRVPAGLGPYVRQCRPSPRGPRGAAGLAELRRRTAGLAIDTDLRWSLLSALVAHGAAGPDEIEAELDRDRTASGERQAALAHALVPTAESKAETWRRLTGDEKLPNWLQRSMLQGFQHTSQLELTAPYVPRFFEVVDEIWATRASEPAQEFVLFGYPGLHVHQSTVAATDQWLAVEGHPGPLRRLVAEGRDGVVRALAARAKDATA